MIRSSIAPATDVRTMATGRKRRLLTTGVDQDLGQTGSPPSPDFPPDPLTEVDDTGPNGEAPALVTQAVISDVEGEDVRVMRVGTVADEATSCVGVEANHEEECEVVSVPECLETLVPDLVMSSCVHKDHDE